MIAPQMHRFCSYCGNAFEHDGWPRMCRHCGQTTFRNPTPVAVVIVPVEDGLLTVRRGIDPKKGMLTIPGGYVDYGETWQQAAIRELREETGIEDVPLEDLRTFDVISTTKGHMVTIYGMAPPRRRRDLPPFKPTEEALELVILAEPQELAFVQDNQVMERFFRERSRS